MKREAGLASENSQSSQMAKDTKTGTVSGKKACSAEKAKGLAGQAFAPAWEESEGQCGVPGEEGLFEQIRVGLTPFCHLSRTQE